MIEIKILGRGGQGAVSAAYVLASAAFKEGLISQGMVMFGIERRGSPVSSFVRIDKKEIRRYDHIYSPDVLLILDPTLLSTNPDKNMKKGGLVVVNTKKRKEELNLRNDLEIRTIDATGIALKIFKQPYFNVPVISAFASITGMISLESIYKAIEETWGKKGERIIQKNKEAAREAYESIKEKYEVKL